MITGNAMCPCSCVLMVVQPTNEIAELEHDLHFSAGLGEIAVLPEDP